MKKALLISLFIVTTITSVIMPSVSFCGSMSIISTGQQFSEYKDINSEINQLNSELYLSLGQRDLYKGKLLVDSIIKSISDNDIEGKTLSDSYYLIGHYYSFLEDPANAILYLKLSVTIRNNDKILDSRFAYALHNLGYEYYNMGDFNKAEEYYLKSIDIGKKVYSGRESDFDLISTYSSLVTVYVDLHEYEKAIIISNIVLEISKHNADKMASSTLANIYNSLGVLYMYIANYAKAKVYLDEAEHLYNTSSLEHDESYITLMNSLAITNKELGFEKRSEQYYEKGIKLAISNNSRLAYNLVNSYALILGNNGRKDKGEILLNNVLKKTEKTDGANSNTYFNVLSNYAYYLWKYNINRDSAIKYYRKCIAYLDKNNKNQHLRNSVYTVYAQALLESGKLKEALKVIQSLLSPVESDDLFYNPDINFLKADNISLEIVKTKYKILCDLYKKTNDISNLEATSNTSELIIGLLEKIRLNISEDESRLLLGDRYRDAYVNTIRDFDMLYTRTGNNEYLEKAFEYSEKSKVAGLLASTRELRAVQFNIPEDIANKEKELKQNIALLNARISDETSKSYPDTLLITSWNKNLLENSRKRDSLVGIFEKQYPGYYSIKYNTKVAGIQDIRNTVGRAGNYVNYIVSDTIMYVFVVNRRYNKLLTIDIDTSFFDNIRTFRNMLAFPSRSDRARETFENYISTGYKLYETLIMPLKKYLISDKLIISPDNILSYLPFETFPTSSESNDNIIYRDISYLMNEFDISYTYSATFMSEYKRSNIFSNNNLIAFAPSYNNIDNNISKRNSSNKELSDLPYARQEAEYIAGITDGKLFENDKAKESVFKQESGKYDIIHLAMHTLLNNDNPMNSTLVFSSKQDSTEDNLLKTYEIYGIPLKAKMVVLSSCNTGTGYLSSGEGILSLARGFIYSGSNSVVMSMWEIEDRSGTEIVKMFYDNLKKGYSKSMAIRKARRSYLKHADQLRSHPYFWSALVIYGNDSPLYLPKNIIYSGIVLIIVLFSYFIYHRRRKYS